MTLGVEGRNRPQVKRVIIQICITGKIRADTTKNDPAATIAAIAEMTAGDMRETVLMFQKEIPKLFRKVENIEKTHIVHTRASTSPSVENCHVKNLRRPQGANKD